MRKQLTFTAVGLLALGVCSELRAAPPGPSRRPVRANERPALSPYLDLLRRDRGGFSVEYFRETRPRLQIRESIGQNRRAEEAMRRQQARTQSQLGTLVNRLSTLTATGHTAGFMTHSRFFGTGRR